jgi:hypothetical protein
MRLAQVIVLVASLDAGREEWEARGFRVDEGGRHPGRGTANLIIPLGEQYIELLTVVDRAEALTSPDGRPVLDALARRGPGVARWSVEPDDMDAVAARLGLPVEDRVRVRPDGVEVRWRAVAVNEAWASPDRCSFMTWPDAATRPARNDRPHANRTTAFSLAVGSPDAAAVVEWIGGTVPGGVAIERAPAPTLRLDV